MSVPPSDVPPVPPPAEPLPPPAPAPLAGAKADQGKRIVAALIDAIPAVVAAFFAWIPFIGGPIAAILAGGWWLVRDGLELEFADRRSIGKKVMKLRPVRLDGRAMDLETSVKRNAPLVIGYVGFFFWIVPVIGPLVSAPVFAIGGLVGIVELVLVLTDADGRRFGDKFAGTKVVETAD